MIGTTTFYKQMKKWVAGAKSMATDKFHCITFTGVQAMATDTHRLVVVKNYPSTDPHFENVNGQRVDDITIPASSSSIADYITNELTASFQKVVPKPEQCQWSQPIHPTWYPHMKNSFEFIKKASKRDEYPGSFMLNYHDGKLYAICGGGGDVRVPSYGAKFLLADGLKGDIPWYGYWNANYLVDAMDFVIDSGATDMVLSMSFTRHPDPQKKRESDCWTGMWKIETSDLVMISTCVRVGSNYGEKLFHTMTTDESKILESGGWWIEE